MDKKFESINLLLKDFFLDDIEKNEEDLIQLGLNLQKNIKNFDDDNQVLAWQIVGEQFLNDCNFSIITWVRKITNGINKDNSSFNNEEENLNYLKNIVEKGFNQATSNLNSITPTIITAKKLH